MASMRSVLYRVADTVSFLRRVLRDAEQNRRRNTSSADDASVQHASIEAFSTGPFGLRTQPQFDKGCTGLAMTGQWHGDHADSWVPPLHHRSYLWSEHPPTGHYSD